MTCFKQPHSVGRLLYTLHDTFIDLNLESNIITGHCGHDGAMAAYTIKCDPPQPPSSVCGGGGGNNSLPKGQRAGQLACFPQLPFRLDLQSS
jgi:hypothetical protein